MSRPFHDPAAAVEADSVVLGPALRNVGELAGPPIVQVRIDSLRGSDSPRLAGEDPGHLRALADLDGPLPPIVVHRQSMRVIDGMHRLRAAQLRGEKHVQARFFDGDEAACFVLAVEANVLHGLPLSLADRKVAAARILTSYPEWSDRRIATVAGLSARTVAAIREHRTSGARRLEAVRIGRDGRARPLDAARRRARASKLLADNPTASLRAIAREAGISPETVRGLRARLELAGASEEGQGQTGSAHRGVSTGKRRKLSVPSCHAPGPDGTTDLSVVSTLTADPALRSTDLGRALLRMLNSSAALARYGEQISGSVPSYCLPTLAEAARACSQTWQDFAAYIENVRSLGLRQ